MTTIRNGVNVDDLMTAIEAVKEDHENGKLSFTVHSSWKNGFKANHKSGEYVVGKEGAAHLQDHSLQTDEPREILGQDAGISPAETLMSSLAACLTVGYAANAAAMGIDIDDMTFEITGNGSIEGFMNIGDARPGLSDISVTAHIKSKSSPDQIQALHDYVNEHSPIWDTLARPISVSSKLAA